jgi:hypothetical protein
VKAAEAAQAEAEARAKELGAAKSVAEKKIQEVDAAKTAAEARVKELELSVSAAERKVASLEGSAAAATAHAARIAELETAHAALDARTKEMTAAQTALEEQLKEVTAAKAEAEAKAKAVEAANAEAEAQIKSLNVFSAAAAKEHAACVAQMESAQAALSAELSDLRAKKQELEVTLARVESAAPKPQSKTDVAQVAGEGQRDGLKLPGSSSIPSSSKIEMLKASFSRLSDIATKLHARKADAPTSNGKSTKVVTGRSTEEEKELLEEVARLKSLLAAVDAENERMQRMRSEVELDVRRRAAATERTGLLNGEEQKEKNSVCPLCAVM